MSRYDRIALWVLGAAGFGFLGPFVVGAVWWLWTGHDIFPWIATTSK